MHQVAIISLEYHFFVCWPPFLAACRCEWELGAGSWELRRALSLSSGTRGWAWLACVVLCVHSAAAQLHEEYLRNRATYDASSVAQRMPWFLDFFNCSFLHLLQKARQSFLVLLSVVFRLSSFNLLSFGISLRSFSFLCSLLCTV